MVGFGSTRDLHGLDVYKRQSNIPVDVLQEMNQTSGKNLFLPHNELYFTEAETISDTVTKHKIVIKESGASGEVRTYEVLLKKDQETKAVTFELTDVTEKVEKMAVNYSPVYQPVSAPVVERAEESGEELASEAPAETSPEVKEETEAPVASKAETRSETLNAPSAYTLSLIHISVAMVAVMISKKAVVEMIVMIRKNVTVRIIKNHVTLQAKRKQALLFVTRAINKKKRFKMNRFFI